MARRTHQILFRLNDKEYQSLLEKVERSGLSREAFLRSMLEGKEIKELPPIQLFDVLRELRQLNANMNQIALKAHSLNLIDAPYYEKCHKDLQAIVGEIKREIFK